MFRFSIYLFVCNCIYFFACFFVCLKLHISLLFIETHSMFCIHLLVCLQLYMISPILCCVDVLLFCFLFIYLSVLFHSFFEELKPNPPLVIHFLGQNQHWSVCSLADFEWVRGENSNADSFPWLVFPEVLIWIPTHWVSFMPQWWWLQLVKCFAEAPFSSFLLPWNGHGHNDCFRTGFSDEWVVLFCLFVQLGGTVVDGNRLVYCFWLQVPA